MTVTCQNNVCILGEIKIRLNSRNAWKSGFRNLHNVSNKRNKWKGVFLENVLFPQLVKTFSTLCENRRLFTIYTSPPPLPIFRLIKFPLSVPLF